jgi:hypothetical protein
LHKRTKGEKVSNFLELERKVWKAIFGTKEYPDGYDVVEHPMILRDRAIRRMTSEGTYAFDIPVKTKNEVKVVRFLQQNPKKSSKWGRLAERGFKIMWLINLETNAFIMRYSNIKGQERVNLKEEKIAELVKNAKVVNFGNILR